MKYAAPDLKMLKKGRLTNEMKDIIFEYMDDELMTPEVHEVWEGFAKKRERF